MTKPMQHTALNIVVVYVGTSKVIKYYDGSTEVDGNLRGKKTDTFTWTCAMGFAVEIQDYTPPSGPRVAAFEKLYVPGSPFSGPGPFTASPNPNGGGYILTLKVKSNPNKGTYKYGVAVTEPGGGEVRDDPQIIIN
jgi:hypothetical protein